MEEELIGDQRLDKLKGHIKKHKHEWRRFIICVIGIGKILGVCVATPYTDWPQIHCIKDCKLVP